MSRYTRMLRKAARAAARSQNPEIHGGSLLLDDVPDHIQARLDGNVLIVRSIPSDAPQSGPFAARNGSPVHTGTDDHVDTIDVCVNDLPASLDARDDRAVLTAETPPHSEFLPTSPLAKSPSIPIPERQPADTCSEMVTVTRTGGDFRSTATPQPASVTRPRQIPVTPEGWLWPGKIRCGDLAVVVGESGAGASTVTSDWIARLTGGLPFPGCPPHECHPAAEVLVFNALEEFSRTILPRITEMGGDAGQILLASEQLLAWGAGEIPGDQPPLEGLEAQTRVRLHTSSAITRLDQLLRRRPSIRMILIDQLKLHIRCDSERVFEGLIHELAAIARRNDVAIVLTQVPDAFRKSGGAARFLKSPSLVQCARSIWRIVASDSDRFGERVLDCLKLSHPVRGDKPGPWHLRLAKRGPLDWLRGRGGALLASSSAFHEQGLKTACRFLERELQIKEGVARWHDLVRQAAANGIDGRWLRDAVLKMNLDSSFDVSGDYELTRIVGYPEDMVSIQRGLNAAHSRNAEDLQIFQQRALEPSRPWDGHGFDDTNGTEENCEEGTDENLGGEEIDTGSSVSPSEALTPSHDSGTEGSATEVNPSRGATSAGPAFAAPSGGPIPGATLRSIKPELVWGGNREGEGALPGANDEGSGRGERGLLPVPSHGRAI
ncbi:MAG TPA: hypothetical protein DDY91_12315 [Planctomycetaceae bacterium]|nr:hypothetical protein [Planctomycetaceae bacterium]